MNALLAKLGLSVLGIGGIIGLARRFIPGLVKKEVSQELSLFLETLKDPTSKELALALLKFADTKFKALGPDKYSATASYITSFLPLLKGQEAQIAGFLQDLEGAVQSGVEASEGPAPQ